VTKEEEEREREKGESLAHGTHGTPRKREREREMKTNADASTRNTIHSSFETVFIFPSLAREDIISTDDDDGGGDWKIGRLEDEEKKKKKKKNRALYSRRFLAVKSHRSFSSPRRLVPPTLCPSKGRAFSPRLGS
jgi:hypothetical protein